MWICVCGRLPGKCVKEEENCSAQVDFPTSASETERCMKELQSATVCVCEMVFTCDYKYSVEIKDNQNYTRIGFFVWGSLFELSYIAMASTSSILFSMYSNGL